MSILLLNNTEDYHSGCKTVIKTFNYDFSVKTSENISELSKFTSVILNGEGTMHNNKPNAIKFLQILRQAQNLKIPTSIYNTVWQNMTNEFDDVLAACSTIEVREVLSHNELKYKHNVSSIVKPDRSLLINVPFKEYQYTRIYEGQYFFNYKPLGIFPRIDIFNESWCTLVNKLRNADLLITNRHHEMYAAIKANCKFICLPSNSHKIEGLFASVDEPAISDYRLIPDVLLGKYDYIYDKIQEFCFK